MSFGPSRKSAHIMLSLACLAPAFAGGCDDGPDCSDPQYEQHPSCRNDGDGFVPGVGEFGLTYNAAAASHIGCSGYVRTIDWALENKSSDLGGAIVQHIKLSRQHHTCDNDDSPTQLYYYEAFPFPPSSYSPRAGFLEDIWQVSDLHGQGEWEFEGEARYFETVTLEVLAVSGFVDGGEIAEVYPQDLDHMLALDGQLFSPTAPGFWADAHKPISRRVSLGYSCCQGEPEQDWSDNHEE